MREFQVHCSGILSYFYCIAAAAMKNADINAVTFAVSFIVSLHTPLYLKGSGIYLYYRVMK